MVVNPFGEVLDKRHRQAALLKLIRSRKIANQMEAVAGLKEAGVPATQASVSRDIRELALVKVGGYYQPASRVVAESPGTVRSPAIELVIGVEPIGANLVIVHTTPGSASAVAAELDKDHWPAVAGTIAGDDTIFIAVRSRTDQGMLLAMVNGWLKQKGATQ